MARTPLAPVLQYLRSRLGDGAAGEATDAQLLRRFVAGREEAAFEALLRRHGPLVWQVCRRVLPRTDDAEDAFQATFLVLLRKAASVRKQASLASWLHGVAHRVALKAREEARRRDRHEPRGAAPVRPDVPAEASWREVQAVLGEEVLRLPERLRAPFVLCCLEGQTRAEAARRLGWKEGTVASRLARARQRLRGGLARRGVVLPAAAFAALPAADAAPAVPPPLLEATRKLAALVHAGEAPAAVAGLVQGALQAM